MSPTAPGVPLEHPDAPGVAVAVPRPRLAWMDTLRGGAILLMLLWHATSLPRLGGMEVPGFIVQVNEFFLPFRMPTLMFLSGLLLPRSLAKPVLTYYRGKIALVAWPWFVWMVVYRFTDGSAKALLQPTSYFGRGYVWYLGFLCVYYLVAPLLRDLPRWLAPILLLAVSVVVQPAGSIEHRVVYFAIFFFTGAWMASLGPDSLERLTRPRSLAVLLLPAVLLGVVSTRTDIAYVSTYVPASLAGIFVAIGVAAALPDGWTRSLQFVGRHSIVYYVAHFPFMLGALWLMQRVGWPALVVVPALLATGIGVGTVLAHHREQAAVRWLFEMPFLLHRGRRPVRDPA